jgi:hypothetical protein
MNARMLCKIPPKRRDSLFAEIRTLVSEIDAIDRSLAGIGEGWAIDDALAEIVTQLGGELRRCSRRRVKRTSKVVEHARAEMADEHDNHDVR